MINITPKSLADWTIAGDEKDLRQEFVKDRRTFLKAYWSDRSPAQVLTLYVMTPILVITVIASIIFGFFTKALILLLTYLVYFMRSQKAMEKYHSLFEGNEVSLMIESTGLYYVMPVSGGSFNIPLVHSSWKEVRRAHIYDDHAVIYTGRRSSCSMYFMRTDNPKVLEKTIRSYWKMALFPEEAERFVRSYSDEDRTALKEFVERKYGTITSYWSEKNPEYVKTDIALIPADGKRNFHTLCTIGCGTLRMGVPLKHQQEDRVPDRVELMIHLPSGWKTDDESLSGEAYGWPVGLLGQTASLVEDPDDWYGWGETLGIEEGVAPEKFQGIIFLCPLPEVDKYTRVTLPSGKSVAFLQIFPLTKEDMEHVEELKQNISNDPKFVEKVLENRI